MRLVRNLGKTLFYSMQIEPHHVAAADGLVIIRPYVRREAFARGAERLAVIGRAGVGTDKIDLKACTENDVAVFNAPDSLTHSTASAAMVFILALAKQLPAQERIARSGDWRSQANATGNDLIGQTLGIVGLGAYFMGTNPPARAVWHENSCLLKTLPP